MSIFEHVVDGDTKLVSYNGFGFSYPVFAFEFVVVFFDGRSVSLGNDDDLRKSPFEMGIADFAMTAFDFLSR